MSWFGGGVADAAGVAAADYTSPADVTALRQQLSVEKAEVERLNALVAGRGQCVQNDPDTRGSLLFPLPSILSPLSPLSPLSSVSPFYHSLSSLAPLSS